MKARNGDDGEPRQQPAQPGRRAAGPRAGDGAEAEAARLQAPAGSSPNPGAGDGAEAEAARLQAPAGRSPSRDAGDAAARAWQRAGIAVVLIFAASRVFYRAAMDIRFDDSPVSWFLQYLDPWFVEHDFLRSVLYLHHQAPLQILVVQGSIKLLGAVRASVFLEGLYVSLGLSLCVALLAALRRLGAPPALGAVAVSLYAVFPTSILYENWLVYSLPTAALLAWSLVALLRYLRLGTLGAALLFFSLLGAIGLLRATFGLPFLCAAIGLLLLRPAAGPARAARAAVLKAAAAPLIVVALNTAKTSLLVGCPLGTALLWQNLCVKIYVHLPAGERHRLVAEHLVSNAGDYRGVIGDAAAYGPFRVEHAPTGVPLLDMDRTPGGGLNAHALEHVLVAERYYRPDAVYLLSHYPAAYARSVWDALSTQYVWSAAQADGLDMSRNMARLAGLRARLDRALGTLENGRCLGLVVGLPVAWLYGLRRLRRACASFTSARSASTAISYMLLAIGYSAAVTLLISFGDFNRYRFDVDPFYLVLLVLLFADVAGVVKRCARRRWGRWGRWGTRRGRALEHPGAAWQK